MPVALLLVALGGAVGCLARTGLEVALGQWHGLMAGQALANVSGAFALGLLTGRLRAVPVRYAAHVALLLGTGLLGGWTTYSGLALQTLTALEDLGTAVGAGLLLGSVLLGLVAAGLGLRIATRSHRTVAR